ncbi:MAG: cell division protein FtsB [Sulfurimonas sp.]|jgi:cell division protein FtsB
MKIFLIILLLVSFLQSDEMQRIESIIQDIAKLRTQYEECKNSLNTKETLRVNLVKHDKDNSKITKYEKKLKVQRENNIILTAEVEYLNERKINYENIIKKYKKLLIIKEKDILALNKKMKNNIKSTKLCPVKQDDNPFPKLMLKENAQIKEKEKVQITKANTFRLKSDSSIFDAPNANQIYFWTKETSFTSNMKTENWVKITGFFIDKKWKKAKQDMWIEKTKVSKR